MQLIPNQPINFGTYFETVICPPCVDDKEYCALYNHGDNLTAQWIADPCSEELISCSFDSGAELITNGDFSSGTTGWTLGAGWTDGGGKVCNDGSPNAISQTLALVNGKRYTVKFIISDFVAGAGSELQLILGGTTYPTGFTADGVYSVSIVAGAANTIILDSNPSFVGCVTNISVKENPPCWDTVDGGWSFENNTACHTDGFTGYLLSTDVVLISGAYYRVTITVAGLTAGSIDLYLGGTTQTVDSNGTFTYFITAGSTSTFFGIVPTTDFDGCISSPSLLQYPAIDDFKVIVIDKDGNIVDDIGSGHLGYANDFVNLLWPISDTLDGCYKICVTEICDEPLAWSNWQLVTEDDATLVINNKLIFTGDAGSGHSSAEHDVGVLQPQIGQVQTCTYTVKIRFGNIDPSYEGLDLQIDLGDGSAHTTIDNTFANSVKSFDFIPSPTINGTIKLTFDDFGTGDLEILYIIIESSCDGEQDPDFCSNCISIKQSHECTFQLIGSCKEPSLGFNFTNFFLSQRLRCSFMNPIGQGANQNYKLSNGSYYKNFAERDKVFDLVFLPVDENTHDAIDTMLRCDFFLVNNILYTWLDSDYKPEWDKKGGLKLVESRIQIRRTSGNLTNSNCS